MNAPRIIIALSITLLLSWYPSTITMESTKGKTPKNQSQMTPNPTNTSPKAPQQEVPQSASQQPKPTPSNQTNSPKIETAAAQQLPAQVAQPVVASVTNNESVTQAEQQSPAQQPTAPTPQQSPKEEIQQLSPVHDIGKVKEPKSDPIPTFSLGKIWYGINASENPGSYPTTDVKSNINRGLNELTVNIKNSKGSKTTFKQEEFRSILDKCKTHNKNLNDIIANLEKNNIEITEDILDQAKQTLKFVNDAFLLPFLLLASTEVIQEYSKNLKALETLDKLRKTDEDLRKQKWLTPEEKQTQQGVEDFTKTLIKYLAAPTEQPSQK